MATLETVQKSQRGESTKPKEEFFSSNSTAFIDTDKTPAQAYVVFRLCKKKRGRTRIDGSCDMILNPKTNRRERIWFLQGATSIWQSELGEVLKDKDYMRANRRGLVFEDSVCRIPVYDDVALEYARANKHNVGSNRRGNGKFDYYEYNPQIEQAEKLKRQKSKIDMVIKASQLPMDKVKKLAAFLGISFVDEIGMPKGDEGVRAELMVKADTFPEQFAKYVDSEEVDVQFMIRKAILEAKIDLTGQQGNALWAGGKGFICKIPAARKPLEYLTELAMTNSDEGKRFKEQLQTVVG